MIILPFIILSNINSLTIDCVVYFNYDYFDNVRENCILLFDTRSDTLEDYALAGLCLVFFSKLFERAAKQRQFVLQRLERVRW